ncbi:MAG: ROK family protein, partial [Mesorhizobium sp.]
RWRDPDRYRDDFIAILLSHGIGMGLVLKGELFTGTHSSGGEFGHMIHRPGGALCRCGRRGCVEAYAGNYAIWRNARQLSENAEPVADVSDAEMRALAARARETDGPEREAYRKAGEALGFGLGSLFALIDPAPVAMVGASAAAFDLIEPALREAIAQTAGGQHSGSISFDT